MIIFYRNIISKEDSKQAFRMKTHPGKVANVALYTKLKKGDAKRGMMDSIEADTA